MYYSAQVLVIGAYFTEMTSRTRMAAKAADECASLIRG